MTIMRKVFIHCNKKRSGIEIGDGAEGWEYNEVGCDASVLVKNNKNFPLIYTKRKKKFWNLVEQKKK